MIEALLAFEYDALEAEERAAVAAHLEGCPACRSRGDRLAEATLSLRGGGPGPDAIWERACEAAAAKGAAPAKVVSRGLVVAVKVECTICKSGLREREAVHCARCLARYHEECYREHGSCGVMGCDGKRLLRPASLEEPAELQPRPKRRSRSKRIFGGVAIAIGVGVALSVAAIQSRRSEERRVLATLARHAADVARADTARARRALARAKQAQSEAAQQTEDRQQAPSQASQGVEHPERWAPWTVRADAIRKKLKAPRFIHIGDPKEVGLAVMYTHKKDGKYTHTEWTVIADSEEQLTLQTNDGLDRLERKRPKLWEANRQELQGDCFEYVIEKATGRILSASIVTAEPNRIVIPIEQREESPSFEVIEAGEVTVEMRELGRRKLRRVSFNGALYDLIPEGPTAGLPLRIRQSGGAFVEARREPRPVGIPLYNGEPHLKAYELEMSDGEVLRLTRDPEVTAMRPFGPTGWGFISRARGDDVYRYIQTGHHKKFVESSQARRRNR